jgi:hypothetical protein
LSPTTISPGSSTSSSTLTISAASTAPPVTGYRALGVAVLLPGLGLFGTVLATRRRKPLTRKSVAWTGLLGLLLLLSIVGVGCGSNSNNQPTPVSQQATVMVTGTSGALSHTAPVTVTIN